MLWWFFVNLHHPFRVLSNFGTCSHRIRGLLPLIGLCLGVPSVVVLTVLKRVMDNCFFSLFAFLPYLAVAMADSWIGR